MNPPGRCRVWVTRAEPGASRTAAALAALGFEAIVAPLLTIRRLAPPVPDLTGLHALAFTSRNGVEAFAVLSPARDLPVFAVGESTARAARDAGFATVHSADGALADLAGLLTTAVPTGAAILAPGAHEAAGDLAVLTGDKVKVRALAVYEALETGIQGPEEFDAVLVHSPRAARALCAALGAGGGGDRIAIAISEAAARALAPAGFSTVAVAARPTDQGVLQALGKVAPAV